MIYDCKQKNSNFVDWGVGSGQAIEICLLCQSQFHAKCTNRNNTKNENTSYFYGKCVERILPFQSLNDNLFMELNGISIENLINQFNEQNNCMGESYNVVVFSYSFF